MCDCGALGLVADSAPSPTKSPYASAAASDAVIAGLLFMAGMRRSEVSVPPLGRTSPTRTPATGSSSPSARGKTNQEGEVKDVRFVKGGVASPAPEDRVVPLSPQMGGAAVCSGGPGLGGRRHVDRTPAW